MEKQIKAIKYTYYIDNETYNIYSIIDNDKINFYIERIDYKNLFYILSIKIKDIPNNINQFINDNLNKWIFLVMNETEED